MEKTVQTVTIGVIAYNEHQYLPDLLQDIINQDYPCGLTEIILVDGQSTDDTLQIMRQFQTAYRTNYKNVLVLNNPQRIQSAGWNIVINHFTSDVLIRVDAHARIPRDYAEKCIACINSGENVCGGPRENIIDENTSWKNMLLTAEQSLFGSGIAPYRQEISDKKYVKTVFHGAYRREVIDRVGLFNEDLIRTEDNEYHYRIRKAGYRICYDPQIHSEYQTRNRLSEMIRQKYHNGLWVGKTLIMCPECISLFHLVPCFFVTALLVSVLLALFVSAWPVVSLLLLYGSAAILTAVMATVRSDRRNIYCVLLPAVFFLLHVSYGAGTIKGLMSRILCRNPVTHKNNQSG